MRPPGRQARAAAEGSVANVGRREVAGAVDEGLQPRGQFGIERVARLDEGLEAVGVQHLAPEIAVIAGRIAFAREYVLEMRRGVTHRDRIWHFDRGQFGGLKRWNVDLAGM